VFSKYGIGFILRELSTSKRSENAVFHIASLFGTMVPISANREDAEGIIGWGNRSVMG
jgi:hypothetical protein